jgi:hypothetical protein
MKFFLFATLLSLTGIAQNNKFDDYIFGSSITEYKNITLEIEEGNTLLYSTDKGIRDVEVNEVNLTFTKNKLTGISIRTKNASAEKLLSKLKGIYGEPTSEKASRYEWRIENLVATFEKDKSGKEAWSTIYYSDKKATASK